MGKILVDRWRRGAPLTANRLNDLEQRVPPPAAGGDVLYGPSVAAVGTGRRTTIMPVGSAPRGLGAIIQPFAVRDVEDDYLVCRVYYPADDSIDSVDIPVAKPYLMRKTPLDGVEMDFDQGANPVQTITHTYDTYRRREADDGADTEYQVPTGDYVTDVNNAGRGEIILAVQIPALVVMPVSYVTSATWQADTRYAVGARVQPTSPAAAPNENLFYQCVDVRTKMVNGEKVLGTSGSTEPAWPTTLYETIVDAECVWICQRFLIEWQDLNTAGRYWGKES